MILNGTLLNELNENQRALLSLSSVDPGAATSLRGFYEWQASDFERSLRYRYERAGGRYLVCPICVNSKKIDSGTFIAGAEMGGTVPLWQWIGDDHAVTFSY